MQKSRVIGRLALWIFPFMVLGASAAPMPVKLVPDPLTPAPAGTVQFGERLGQKLDLCLTNQVLYQDIEKIIKPFRDRKEVTLSEWRGEYWGKWYTSAVLAYEYRPTGELKSHLAQATQKLLENQQPDGYLGTHPDDHRLETWDLWCRKYVLLGLIADYDLTGNRAVLEATQRNADTIIDGIQARKLKILETGFPVLQGLDSSSILEPIVLLYQRTGEAKYLEFAQSIMAEFSAPSKGAPEGLKLIENALAGAPPHNNHAYCIMSIFEGVCELYRATGDKRFLDAAVGFAQSVRRYDAMIHGSVSNKEKFYQGVIHQTDQLDEQAETCATATWMKLCHHLLRLTGDSVWADELEKSHYNALLGAMAPQGEWWAYFSPLKGARAPSHVQHMGDVGLSCCVANGPRGLLLAPRWAVMSSQAGPVINLYAPGTAEVEIGQGSQVKIRQETDYPVNGKVKLTVTSATPARFVLSLRIPSWSQRTSLSVNNQTVPCQAGTYAKLDRTWSTGDQLVLELDLRGRSVKAANGDLAVMRGPVLLALDNRLAPRRDFTSRLTVGTDGYVELTPSASKPANIWMAFEVPVQTASADGKLQPATLTLCDFSSAGNSWNDENRYQVWMPQPLELEKTYIDLPWEFTHSEFYLTTWHPTILLPKPPQAPRVMKEAKKPGL